MTRTSLPLDGTVTARDQAPGPDSAAVIILTYTHAGGEQLGSLLARQPDLACTTGTGILPLCEQAAAAWRAVDGRLSGPPSRLAETSTRALAMSMITTMLARQGKRRWCEIATAAPDAAATFLRLFPGTRIVCLHRACPDVVRTALHASPWGLAGPGYAPFTSAYPGSTTAALTSYWATHTTSLLSFEQAHPGICHRVRYEDLAADSLSSLSDFLKLQDPGPDPAAWLHDEAADPSRNAAGPDADFPAGQVPPSLLERANSLMEKLGYPPMRPVTATPGSSR
jgi:hypothetical protein